MDISIAYSTIFFLSACLSVISLLASFSFAFQEDEGFGCLMISIFGWLSFVSILAFHMSSTIGV